MKVRLRANVQFWESIGASHFVLSVIREGYKILFYYTPTSVFLPNNKSALHNSSFVLGTITELLKSQCPQIWTKQRHKSKNRFRSNFAHRLALASKQTDHG